MPARFLPPLLAAVMSAESSTVLLVAALACMLVLALVGKIPLGYNLRNLTVRWRTTLLTALAFTLVVGLMIVMLAFVDGMYKLTEDSGQPGNVMVLSDGATDELFSNLGFTDIGDIERQPRVRRNAAGQPICSREVYLVVNQQVIGPSGETLQRRFTQVRGVEDPLMAAEAHGLDLFPGGAWFCASGVQALPGAAGTAAGQQAIQAVLGEGIADQLGPDLGKPRLEVGDVFDLGPRKWIVVGLLRSAGSTFGSEVWAKRGLIGPMFGKDAFSSLVLRTDDAANAKALSQDLNNNFKKAALFAQPETEYFSKLSETNRQFLVAIIFVTVFMSLGGVCGVMNTMFAAISQRTKDIGVMRILGFARWQLLVSFFLESLVIALIGGALGCSLGYLVDGLKSTSIISSGQGGGKSVTLELIVSPETLMFGLLMALGMGALGAVLPCLAAMRVRPLESLR